MKQSQEQYVVQSTTNYDLFNEISGNRELNALHLKRLEESFNEKYLISPIIVNERHEIIDGQHRFFVCQKLELPVYYIVIRGYGLREVQMLNANTKNWAPEDFLNAYCDTGHHEYLKLRQFRNEYGLTIPTCIILCNGASSEGMDSFKSGTYTIKNFARASDMAKKMNVLKLHYSGFQRRSFVIAMVDMFSNPRFSFPEFIAKLKAFPSLMINCQDKKAYMDRIELIYNYKRREKVNLRF